MTKFPAQFTPSDFPYPVIITEGEFFAEIDVNPQRHNGMSLKEIMRPWLFIPGAEPTTMREKLVPLRKQMLGLKLGNGRKK